ncbi:hypothetical protein [Nitrososphaera sp.]|uniref:hypothetical protein n=1 Tax=Nitrososphaera sp. TaxID=1971748 RepID=UPI002EDA5D5B
MAGIEAKLPDNQAKKKSEIALELVSTNCIELFADQYQKPYAVIEVNAHVETISINSIGFKHWIARMYYGEKQATLSSEDISAVLNILKGKAVYDGTRRHIEIRAAEEDSTIYYDLTNTKWECVKVTRDGWTVEQAPVLFARHSNNAPQAEPVTEYPPDIIDRFLSLTNITNDGHKLLLKCYLVSLFIPNIAKPILITAGEQGSGKSLLERSVKGIVDPSAAEKLSFPKSPAELTQQLSHNYVALFDNVSRLDDWQSDELCKAVDGSGSSKRMLYSDDDDIIYNFRRCILLNGINIVARKPDLLDRAIIIQLERIARERRRKESLLMAELDAIRPALLGYIFDILVKVLERKGEVQLTEYPRMADFAEYGELIARCMGYNENEFTRAYFENIKLQSVEVLEANPVATAVMKLMEPDDLRTITATPRELLEMLESVAAGLKISTNGRTWPKAPNSLSRRLNEVKTNLREIGILVEIATDSKTNTRVVRIEKTSPEPPVSPEGQNRAQTTLPMTGDTSGDMT